MANQDAPEIKRKNLMLSTLIETRPKNLQTNTGTAVSAKSCCCLYNVDTCDKLLVSDVSYGSQPPAFNHRMYCIVFYGF